MEQSGKPSIANYYCIFKWFFFAFLSGFFLHFQVKVHQPWGISPANVSPGNPACRIRLGNSAGWLLLNRCLPCWSASQPHLWLACAPNGDPPLVGSCLLRLQTLPTSSRTAPFDDWPPGVQGQLIQPWFTTCASSHIHCVPSFWQLASLQEAASCILQHTYVCDSVWEIQHGCLFTLLRVKYMHNQQAFAV